MIDSGLAQRLPEEARQKLLLIDGLASDADDLANVAQDRLNKIARFSGGADNPHAVRLAAKVAVQSDRHRALLDLVHAIERWLRAVPPQVEFEMVADALPSLGDGETFEEAVVRVRAKIGEMTVARFHVTQTREPRAILKERLRDQVRRLAGDARPSLRLERGLTEAVWVDQRADFGLREAYLVGMLAWLDPEKMDAALSAMVDDLPDTGTMTADEQAKALADLDGELEELQRAEESLIEAAFADGVDVLRRAGAEPRCVLGLRVVTEQRPARRPRPPGPFVEHQAAE
jgi:hypothetical protein